MFLGNFARFLDVVVVNFVRCARVGFCKSGFLKDAVDTSTSQVADRL